MSKSTRIQHYIPSSYSKRMFSDKKTFYFFDYKTKEWTNKNPSKTNSAKRIYNLTDDDLLKTGFKKDHIEKYFSKFEGKFWELFDKKIVTLDPYQIGSWLMKLDLHIYERHPVTLKMLSLSPNTPLTKEQINIVENIANNEVGEGFGEIYLKLRLAKKEPGYKAKHLGDISTRNLVILKFNNEMPISNQPRIMVGFFEKGSLPGATVHAAYKDYFNHPAIIQIDAKTWYLFHGEPKMFLDNEKYTLDLFNSDYENKNFQKIHESMNFEYKICNVPERWEERIRYAMVIGGAICSEKRMGVLTTQILFEKNIIKKPHFGQFVIFKDAPELLFTKGAFSKFLFEVNQNILEINYSKHTSDELVSAYRELDKIEEELLNLK